MFSLWEEEAREGGLLMQETIKAYIAGFIDGEATITITKSKRRRSANWHYSLTTIISNTDLKPLRFIQKYYGGFITTQKAIKSSNKPRRLLKIATYDSRRLLKDIQKYSILKREHIKVAFSLIEIKERYAPLPGKKCSKLFIRLQEKCKQKINKLNKKGVQ